MATEHVPAPVADPWRTDVAAPATTTSWAHPAASDIERMPPYEHLAEVAAALRPGKALDLGCGTGADSIWLAEHGWIVKAVDPSPAAIAEARAAAAAAGVERSIVFDVADLATARPVSRYDLVFCTMAVPARGTGRSRVLESAAAAVAPGGTILLSDLDVSLQREGWMSERYLVSADELERYLDGFRIERSGVRLAPYRHGFQERVLPVTLVVATRRTDLREHY